LIEQRAEVSPLVHAVSGNSIMDTVDVAAQSGLSFLRQYQQENPFDLDDDRFVRLHEWLLDFRDCKNVVMVMGCGAFPATLLWLSDNFPTLHYVGLRTL
jgi:hypothetical protein